MDLQQESNAGQSRYSGEQFAGVVVPGLVEHFLGCADFQESAGPHDSDARGDLRHDG
jgi:hypothetical protein